MTDEPDTPSADQLHRLPACPEVAMFVAGTFRRLGGALSIDGRGHRYAGRPECPEMLSGGTPQLPGAAPHETFHSDGEWRGAIKLVDYWLHRLSVADKELIFTFLASVPVDSAGRFDFREQLR